MRFALKKASRIIAAVLGVCVAIALMPAAAQASPAAKSSPGVTQVLVAEGDGWRLYAEVPKVHGAGGVTPMTVVDCGYVTCSVYLSRAQTQWAQYNVNALGGGLIGLGAACATISTMSGPAAPFVAIACGAEVATLGVFLSNALSHAAGDNGCLRIRYGVLPTAFYDDHGSFCYNT